MQIEHRPIREVLNIYRLRADLGDVEALANSIAEYGLLQPVVVSGARVVAGGRRLKAFDLLNKRDPEKWATVPVVDRGTMSKSDLHILEIEENIQRKDMTWQERVKGVFTVHKHKIKEKALNSDTWLQSQTATMLNLPAASLSVILIVGEELYRNPQSPIQDATSINDALGMLLKQKRQELERAATNRYLASQRDPVEVISSFTNGDDPDKTIADVDIEELPDSRAIDLSWRLAHGDCLDVLGEMPAASIDHVVTDPPYAIDVTGLEGGIYSDRFKGTDQIKETHTVEGNLALYKKILPELYRVTRPHSWVVLFCDPYYWQEMYELGLAAGFVGQSYPLIWVKSNAFNPAGKVNFTKNYETILVLRREHATLNRPAAHAVFAHNVLRDDRTKLGNHPFIKPFAIWHDVLSNFTTQGQTVLDPFAGVGSSIGPIIALGCNPIAVEIDDAHFNTLLLNMQQAYRDIHGHSVSFYGVPASKAQASQDTEASSPLPDLPG